MKAQILKIQTQMKRKVTMVVTKMLVNSNGITQQCKWGKLYIFVMFKSPASERHDFWLEIIT